MNDATTTEYGTSTRFFPHHTHFVGIEKWGLGHYNYGFREFSENEPKPEKPDCPAYVPDGGRSADDEARLREWRERASEYEAAHKAWEQARYFRQVTPLVEAAINARPPVDEALAAMRSAWEALDTAAVWPVAVKHLLDAQGNARTALARWVDDYAYPLAKAEGEQSYYISERVADWQGIAAKINGGQDVAWEIGWYYAGDHHCRAGYSSSPLVKLDETIQQQRARLAEIARYSGERTS